MNRGAWRDHRLDLLVETVDQLNDRYAGDWRNITCEELAFVLSHRADFRMYMCGKARDASWEGVYYTLFFGRDRAKLRRAARLAGFEVAFRGYDVVRFSRIRRKHVTRKAYKTSEEKRMADRAPGVHPGGGTRLEPGR